jgi:hypothetical protein
MKGTLNLTQAEAEFKRIEAGNDQPRSRSKRFEPDESVKGSSAYKFGAKLRAVVDEFLKLAANASPEPDQMERVRLLGKLSALETLIIKAKSELKVI